MRDYFLSADLNLADGEDDQPQHFSGTAYSGGLIPSWNAVVDLASTEIVVPAPLLLEHDRSAFAESSSPIGLIEEARKANSLEVSGQIFADIDDRARDVAAKAKRGVKWQMSMGIFNASEERVPQGQSVTVNGRSFAGPINVVRRGQIREASITVLGADPNTSARFFNERNNTMTPEQMQARIAELEAQVSKPLELAAVKEHIATLETRTTEAEKAVADVRKAARLASVKALFSELKRDATDTTMAPYLELAEPAFELLAKDLRESAKAGKGAPAHLFREQATGDQNQQQGSALLRDADARGWKAAH